MGLLSVPRTFLGFEIKVHPWQRVVVTGSGGQVGFIPDLSRAELPGHAHPQNKNKNKKQRKTIIETPSKETDKTETTICLIPI